MPNSLYVLLDSISNLIDSAEYSRDFFSLVVKGKYCPHAHTKKDIHKTCVDPVDIWGYICLSNPMLQ
jgi:hypothetical protein